MPFKITMSAVGESTRINMEGEFTNATSASEAIQAVLGGISGIPFIGSDKTSEEEEQIESTVPDSIKIVPSLQVKEACGRGLPDRKFWISKTGKRIGDMILEAVLDGPKTVREIYDFICKNNPEPPYYPSVYSTARVLKSQRDGLIYNGQLRKYFPTDGLKAKAASA